MSQINNSQPVRHTSGISQSGAPAQKQAAGKGGGRDLTTSKFQRLTRRMSDTNKLRIEVNKQMARLTNMLGCQKTSVTKLEMLKLRLEGRGGFAADISRRLDVKLDQLETAKARTQAILTREKERLNSLTVLFNEYKAQRDQVAAPAPASARAAAPASAPAAAPASARAAAPASAPAAARAFPDFPGTGTPQQKMDFTLRLLKDFPGATRSELEAKYGDHLKFAGGGQGNVIFVKNTPFVIKQHLAGPEADTYKFLASLNEFFQSGTASPELKAKYTPNQLDTMMANKDAIKASFPMPIALEEGGNPKNTIVVAPNVTYNGNDRIRDSEIADIKIGSRIVSRNELRAHGDKKHSGLRWLMKKFTTRFLPFLKGTKSRGYEFVSQNASKVARIPEGRKSNDNLRTAMDKMNVDQLQSLVDQLKAVRTAHASMPVTFVGSSVMIAMPGPDSQGAMPNVRMGDFAHAMSTGEYFGANTENSITPHTYNKYKENFDQGIGALCSFAESVLAERRARLGG